MTAFCFPLSLFSHIKKLKILESKLNNCRYRNVTSHVLFMLQRILDKSCRLITCLKRLLIKAVRLSYRVRYFKVQTRSHYFIILYSIKKLITLNTLITVTGGPRPRPVVFEVKAKARPLRGQGHDFLSLSRPRGRGQSSRTPSLL